MRGAIPASDPRTLDPDRRCAVERGRCSRRMVMTTVPDRRSAVEQATGVPRYLTSIPVPFAGMWRRSESGWSWRCGPAELRSLPMVLAFVFAGMGALLLAVFMASLSSGPVSVPLVAGCLACVFVAAGLGWHAWQERRRHVRLVEVDLHSGAVLFHRARASREVGLAECRFLVHPVALSGAGWAWQGAAAVLHGDGESVVCAVLSNADVGAYLERLPEAIKSLCRGEGEPVRARAYRRTGKPKVF